MHAYCTKEPCKLVTCVAFVAEGREVIISRKAGEAVLRGAPVFVPGVLAATAGIAEGVLHCQLASSDELDGAC